MKLGWNFFQQFSLKIFNSLWKKKNLLSKPITDWGIEDLYNDFSEPLFLCNSNQYDIHRIVKKKKMFFLRADRGDRMRRRDWLRWLDRSIHRRTRRLQQRTSGNCRGCWRNCDRWRIRCERRQLLGWQWRVMGRLATVLQNFFNRHPIISSSWYFRSSFL